MKYIFILGRNPDLSVQEIFSYLKIQDNKINEYFVKQNALLIDLEKPLKKNIIDNFGGVIAIGKVFSYGKLKNVFEELDKRELYLGSKNNFNYVVWNFGEYYEDISNYLRVRFRSEKLKTTEKKLTGFIESQSGEKLKNVLSKLINCSYFCFEEKSICYFGKLVEFCDYKSLEKRDMGKPVRRESLSISPRLAKIMINLSGAKNDEVILDGFCGIGAILQEALLLKKRVVGIDLDRDAIKGARKNLEWLGVSKQKYVLKNEDSSDVKISPAAVFVSEPDFGKTLKKIVTLEMAKKMQRRFEGLMICVLNNVKRNIKRRFVFTAPFIRIGKKRVGCDIDSILNKTGLSLVDNFPIDEFRKNQIVGRQIFVLKK